MAEKFGTIASRPNPRNFSTIQALRGVAALIVVIYHANWSLFEINRHYDPNRRAFQGGAGGVDIFFVISGFVMIVSTSSVLKAANPASAFLKRRIKRIVPLYWIVTSLVVLLHIVAPSYTNPYINGAGHIVSSYLFLPFLRVPVVPVGWTLNSEMLFYLLFTLSLAFRLPPVRFVSAMLIGLTLSHRFLKPGSIAEAMTDSVIIEFAFGMVVARLVTVGRLLRPTLAWSSIIFGAICLASGAHAHYLPRFIYWGVPALAIIAGAVSLESRVRLTIPQWLLKMGDASYSLYLMHGLVGWFLVRIWVNSGFQGWHSVAAFFAIYIALSIFVGFLVYRWIERPTIEFFRRGHRTRLETSVSIPELAPGD